MPISIHGKSYITVAERVVAFNEKYPNGSVTAKIDYPDEDTVRCQATVWPDCSTPLRFFTGHAEESRKASSINRTSAVENVETSAIGRALGFLGLGIIDGIATADEVVIAETKAKVKPTKSAPFEEDPLKLDIIKKVKALGFEPKSQAEWSTVVKSLTDLDLMKPENYPAILDRLEVRLNEKKV